MTNLLNALLLVPGLAALGTLAYYNMRRVARRDSSLARGSESRTEPMPRLELLAYGVLAVWFAAIWAASHWHLLPLT